MAAARTTSQERPPLPLMIVVVTSLLMLLGLSMLVILPRALWAWVLERLRASNRQT